MPITFDQIKAFDNGARFYTADLHVHSFGASSDVSDVSMTVEAIIDTAFNNRVSILAITDHNSDKNVVAAIE
jgi:predicted metal-dependent phosphoesterase TrpH